jgi:hypothetical protein
MRGAHVSGEGGGVNVPPRGHPIMPPSSLGGGGEGARTLAPHTALRRACVRPTLGAHVGGGTCAPPAYAPRVGRIY